MPGLHHFSQETLREEFEEKGFEVEDFYSDVAGASFNPESTEFAPVAKKPMT